MLANFLIGLREGLEAALIVSILLGYVTRIDRRDLLRPIWTGVVLAVAVSLGVGALLTFGTYGLTTQAQEAIGGALSILAVGFVTWMIFWMVRNSRQLSGVLRADVDRGVQSGRGLAIVAVAFLAVAREGVETSLFIWAAVQATGQSWVAFSGALLGIAVAVVLAVLLARGLVKIDLGRFLSVTAGLLVVVAAGVFSYGLHDLQEAGLLPGRNAYAWDVSTAVPPDSWYGTLLRGTVNFSPQATTIEVIAWTTYVLVVGAFYLRALTRRSQPAARTTAAARA